MKMKEFKKQFSLVTSEKIALSFWDNWFSLGGNLFSSMDNGTDDFAGF
jgi:hypothetical protein